MSRDSATTYDEYNLPNPRLVELAIDTPSVEPTILDVGCWRGALGRAVHSRRKAILEGVDINEDVLVEARDRSGYARTYCLDLDRSQLAEIEDGQFDVIVCGDVLEHTKEPEVVLRRLLTKLKPEGHLVVSLPNIGFIWYRIQLLLGRWEYRDSGVMDRTHLRFFTLTSMRRLFSTTDPMLAIERCCPYIGIANRARVLQVFMRSLARLWPSLFALQIVFKLRPRQPD